MALVAGPRPGTLSRRVVLGGLSAGTGLLLLGPAVHAAADGTAVSVEPFSGDVAFIPTGDGSLVGMPHRLGVQLVALEGRDAGLRIWVDFDPRVYELGAAPSLVTDEGAVLRCRWRVIREGAVQLVVEDALPSAVRCSLVLGRVAIVSFPNDIVPGPKQSVFTIQGEPVTDPGRGRFLGTRGESVWGLRVGAGWREVRWGSFFRSWVPDVVTLYSVGPGPVPAGTRVTVQVDSRLVSGIQLKGRERYRRVKASQQDALRMLSWDLRYPLTVGGFDSALLEVSTREDAGLIGHFQPPTVSAAPAGASVGQRITGGESVQRSDSAHDSESVATYGG